MATQQTQSDSKRLHTLPPPNRGAYQLAEACAYLGGISRSTMHRLIDRGLIRRHPAIRHILISKAELDRFLAGNGKDVATQSGSSRKTNLFPRVSRRTLKLTRLLSQMTRHLSLSLRTPYGSERCDSHWKAAVRTPLSGKSWQWPATAILSGGAN